jgi:hypothetical protein
MGATPSFQGAPVFLFDAKWVLVQASTNIHVLCGFILAKTKFQWLKPAPQIQTTNLARTTSEMFQLRERGKNIP